MTETNNDSPVIPELKAENSEVITIESETVSSADSGDDADKILNEKKIEDVSFEGSEENSFSETDQDYEMPDDEHGFRKESDDESEKQSSEKSNAGRSSAGAEARMHIKILDSFFSRMFGMLAKEDFHKWKLDDDERQDLIEIAEEYYKIQGVMSPGATYLTALIMSFGATGVSAYTKGRKNKKEKSDFERDMKKNGAKNIPFVEIVSDGRGNYQCDNNGFYKYDVNGIYIKIKDRTEKINAKDYEKLILSNEKEMIDSYFQSLNHSE